MVFSAKHKFVSAKTDGADTTIVRPTNWNDEHNLTMATARLLGRATAGAGVVEEISLSADFAFTGTVLGHSAAFTASITGKANKATLVSEQAVLNPTGWSGVTYIPVNNVPLGLNGKIPISDLAVLGAIAPSSRQIIAGLGLTGGGNLTADRTITMGAPGTIDDSSTNAVAAGTHTHNIDEWLVCMSGNALIDAGEIGGWGMLRQTAGAPKGPGETIAGSSLNWTSAGAGGTGSPPGTWECFGKVIGDASSNTANNVTIWKRYA